MSAILLLARRKMLRTHASRRAREKQCQCQIAGQGERDTHQPDQQHQLMEHRPKQVVSIELVDEDAPRTGRGYRCAGATNAPEPSERERELRKLSALSEAVDRGFRERGVDELTAILAAQLAITVFSVTLDRWLDQDGERPLSELVRDTLRALRAVAADPVERPHAA